MKVEYKTLEKNLFIYLQTFLSNIFIDKPSLPPPIYCVIWLFYILWRNIKQDGGLTRRPRLGNNILFLLIPSNGFLAIRFPILTRPTSRMEIVLQLRGNVDICLDSLVVNTSERKHTFDTINSAQLRVYMFQHIKLRLTSNYFFLNNCARFIVVHLSSSAGPFLLEPATVKYE